MEWIIAIGVLWLLATLTEKSGRKNSNASTTEGNWLNKLDKTASDASRRMLEWAKKAEDEAWCRSIFSDLQCQLTLRELSQELCFELGAALLTKTREEATECRDRKLAYQSITNDEDGLTPTPLFDRAAFLEFQRSVDVHLAANLSKDDYRSKLLHDTRKGLLIAAHKLASQCEENKRQIRLGRFDLGWDEYPRGIFRNIPHPLDPLEFQDYSRQAPRHALADACKSHSLAAWQGGGVGETKRPVPLSSMPQGDSRIEFLRERGIDRLYHFTDLANFNSIVSSGGLFSWSYCENNEIRIERPGGSALSRELDARRELENYVRMGFSSDHPMLHAARKDGRLIDPIILEIDLRVLLLQSVLFSNRNATATAAEIGSELDDLRKIRFDLIRSGRWANDDEKGLLQAEVLVYQAVPGYLIRRKGRLLRNPTKDEAASLSRLESAASSRS